MNLDSVTLRLPDELRAWLERHAGDKFVSLSAEVRMRLEQQRREEMRSGSQQSAMATA